MSDWDAPTGSWDPRQEPGASGGPDKQGYQQDEPVGGSRHARGDRGRTRTGRRALPGYDQAQSSGQTTAEYDQGQSYRQDSGYGPGSGYGQQPGYGRDSSYPQQPGYGRDSSYRQQPGYGRDSSYRQQPGYGSGTGPQSGYGSGSGGSGTGQMVRYGQRPADEPAYGSGPRDPLSSDRPDPLSSDPWDPPSTGTQSAFSSAPRHASSQQPSQVSQASPGSEPQRTVGYGDEAAGAYRRYGADEPARSEWSEAGDRPGYGAQPGYGPPYPGQGYGQGGFPPGGPDRQPGPDQGYGAQPGYDQHDYRQPGYGQQSSGSGGPDGFAPVGPADWAAPQAYPRPGAEPSDYPQDGFSRAGFAPDEPPAFSQDPDVTQAYGTPPGYAQNGYGQNGYGQNGFSAGAPATYQPDRYAQDGYGQGSLGPPGAGPDGYPPDPYAQGRYGPGRYTGDGYVQQGFEQPPGPGYDEDFAPGGRPPGSRSGTRSGSRSPQRLGGTRMVLYLAASVVGVVAIVYLVIHLAKSGEGNSAGAPSTPSTSPSATAVPTGYTLKLARNVGNYPLNRAAVTTLATAAKNHSAPMVASMESKGAGRPVKTVIGIYDLGPVTSIASGAYKGIVFVGYDGTFNPAAAIKVVQSHLVSSHVVNAGPHGGEMVCGDDPLIGTDNSECAWVAKTTFGVVQFISGQIPVTYPGGANVALQVRQAVEVPAS